MPCLHRSYLHYKQRHTKGLPVFGDSADGRCVCTGGVEIKDGGNVTETERTFCTTFISPCCSKTKLPIF